MTLRNNEELKQALNAVAKLHVALATLRQEVAPQSQENFEVMAEGVVDEIERLEAEINAYTGLASIRATAAS